MNQSCCSKKGKGTTEGGMTAVVKTCWVTQRTPSGATHQCFDHLQGKFSSKQDITSTTVSTLA